MEFPHTNKLHEGLPEQVESSAEVLQEHLKKIDYRLFIKAYFYGLGVILFTLFSVIATIRLAIRLF